MRNREFYYWCRDAVRKIRYWKDRNKVYGELYAHLEERYEDFLSKGYPEEEAVKMTLEAMGSAEELAPMLGAIHKPYWAYTAIVTRILALAVLINCLGHCIVYFSNSNVVRPNENWWDPYTQGGTKRNYCVASVEPDVSASSDGYYFRVKKATLWRTPFTEPPEDGREYFDQLYMQVTVSNPFLWMYEQQGLRWMWAVDSQGTYYTSFEEADDNTQNHIQYTVYRSGLFTYTYDLSFRDTENDMTWIELHYDRDGRDLVFRVDLAGGGENAG